MALRVVYRSHGGENSKDRPDWYSKRLALDSFLGAVRTASEAGVEVDVVFLNDGPIPEERLAPMRAHGRVRAITGGSNRVSYLAGLRHATTSDWPDEDVVLLAEDDYLWRPDALVSLAGSVRRGLADYWAPYGVGTHDDIEGRRRPRAGRGEAALPDDAVRWVRHESTTSTFAVRLEALRQDLPLLVVACFSGGDFDLTSCLAVQGIPRFHAVDIVRHHPGSSTSPVVRAVRFAYLAVLRTAVDVASVRRPSRRRRLLAADPALCTHMELGWVAPTPSGRPRFWEELAAVVQRRSEGGAPPAPGTTVGLTDSDADGAATTVDPGAPRPRAGDDVWTSRG